MNVDTFFSPRVLRTKGLKLQSGELEAPVSTLSNRRETPRVYPELHLLGGSDDLVSS